MTEQELRSMLARGGAHIVGEQQRPQGAVAFPVPPPRVAPEHQDRYRTKTERLYALTILEMGVASGILKGYWYEPMKGLYLAPKTSYTPDFLVEYIDPTHPLELHEVKGAYVFPEGRQKLKHAAAHYPCFRFILAQWKGQRWVFTDIPSR